MHRKVNSLLSRISSNLNGTPGSCTHYQLIQDMYRVLADRCWTINSHTGDYIFLHIPDIVDSCACWFRWLLCSRSSVECIRHNLCRIRSRVYHIQWICVTVQAHVLKPTFVFRISVKSDTIFYSVQMKLPWGIFQHV